MEAILAKPLSGGDIRVGAGLAANALTIELVAMLWAKRPFSDDEVLTMITGAIDGLRNMAEAQPHPAWKGAKKLLRMQATRFGGPRPGSKPS
jgi:hypothetical protein